MKKRLLIITPHLSTGGAPQFTLNKIELLKDEYDIMCVEYDFLSPDFVVQRNKIISILGDKFKSINDNKSLLIPLIKVFKPHIISMEEFPENFMDEKITEQIYCDNRNYNIFETTHSSNNYLNNKKWLPDKFIFVSNYSANMYKSLGVSYEVIEYPIDLKFKDINKSRKKLEFDSNYKHVLNVGLFTEGKNQKYAFELARNLEQYKIKFHFVGNQAGNFIDYWKPLLDNKPDNCIIWGEREDVSDFLIASDLFLFTSKFELNPLVIKEAISYILPIAMFNLETYYNSYGHYETIDYLSGDINIDSELILKKLEINNDKLDKGYILYSNDKYFETTKMAVKSIREFSKLPIFVYMLNSDLKIDIEGVKTINWSCDLNGFDNDMYFDDGSNFYINRNSDKIYKLLIQRPLIVKDVLEKYLNTVAYVDSDSIATPYVDKIFDYYDSELTYPYFVEGIYEYLMANNKGEVISRDDLSTSLEYPACELFNVDQNIREKYRQTGYFVSGKNTLDFLDEWYWMCINPLILKDVKNYAPFNEETILNVLLWKKKILDGLPYLYVNGTLETITKVYNDNKFTGIVENIGEWFSIPESEDKLMFFHGEKNIKIMEKMINKIKEYVKL